MHSSKIKAKDNLMIMFIFKLLQFCLFDFKRIALICVMLQPDTQFKLLHKAI